MSHSNPNPVVVVGAFERHNLGDLLMERIASWFLQIHQLSPLPASLIAADLRSVGGSRSHAFGMLAPHLPPNIPILHVGGETIPCTLEGALRMNVPASWPSTLASHLVRAHNPTGLTTRRFAYVTPPVETIHGVGYEWPHRFFHAQGASTFPKSEPSTQQAAIDDLHAANWLTARTESSVVALRHLGLNQTRFAWDIAVLQPVLDPGGLDTLTLPPHHQPDGPLLVQANAEFLHHHAESLAESLSRLGSRFPSVRLGIAGLAAQHDSTESLVNLAQALSRRGCTVVIADSPHVSSIVGEIRRAACVVATSLHYRILALTHGVPRVSLANAKTTDWARQCDPDFPSDCSADNVDSAVADALRVPPSRLMEQTMTARNEALQSMHEMIAPLSSSARSADDAWRRRQHHHTAPDCLENNHAVVPREWIDAVGAHCHRLQAERAAAIESSRQSQDKVRQLRQELDLRKLSLRHRILRFVSGHPKQ